MKNVVSSLLMFFMFGTLNAQVKFTALEFDNGLRYPNAVFTSEPSIQDSLNKIIRKTVADLEKSDFCIGDFGYVQKGSHLQIHLMCNCIDMPATEHRYIFVNLTSGKEVAFQDIFEEKTRERALAIIQRTIMNRTIAESECGNSFDDLGNNISWDQISLRLSKDGIEIRPANTSTCEASPVRISYAELSEYFKYKFL